MLNDENETAKGRINDLEYVGKLSKNDQEKRNSEKIGKTHTHTHNKLSIMDTLFQESPCSFNKISRRKQTPPPKKREKFRKTSKIEE